MNKALCLVGAALLALVTAGAAQADKAPPPISFGGPFSLIDHDGKPRTERSFDGKYLLIYFGYTFCPAICPTGLQAMAEAVDGLGEAGAKVQPLFVTIDPARDTPEALKEYVGHFHPRMIGLTGSEPEIARTARSFRVHRRKVVLADAEGPEDYLVDHGSMTYLMAPDGSWLTLFPHNTDPEKMTAAIRRYLR